MQTQIRGSDFLVNNYRLSESHNATHRSMYIVIRTVDGDREKQTTLILLTAFSFYSGAVQAEASKPETLFKLFKALEGNWQCSGAFANGKPLEADISMSLTNGGRALHYRHVDRAPNNYAVSGHWSYFEKLNEMIVTYHSSMDTLSTYRTASWTDKAVSFEAVELLAPPLWRENRFSFSLKENRSLYFVWEVMSEDGWKMGDYLNCSLAIQ